MSAFGEFTSAVTPITMQKREALRVHRAEDGRNRAAETQARVLWFDSRDQQACDLVVPRLNTLRYTGVVVYPDNAARLAHFTRAPR
ncbi:MAG: hypothetical protein ABSC94_33725 [Polyangiaceae bacterium]|jgi:hypothetical protein